MSYERYEWIQRQVIEEVFSEKEVSRMMGISNTLASHLVADWKERHKQVTGLVALAQQQHHSCIRKKEELTAHLDERQKAIASAYWDGRTDTWEDVRYRLEDWFKIEDESEDAMDALIHAHQHHMLRETLKRMIELMELQLMMDEDETRG